ncbi:MAG TPA: inositol monophosphatase family protein, partial [Nocardioides sp.]|nr:inositol monophosphatase family protein [Nocardioides sp.]
MSLSDPDLAGFLVRDAGRLAQGMRDEGLEAFEKTSVSDVVTMADRLAERRITETLLEERPDDGILGEEGASRTGTS